MHFKLLATRHVAQYLYVSVVAQNFSTQFRFLEFVRTDSCFARLVLSRKDQARPADNGPFHHYVGLLAWGVQLQGVSFGSVCSA